MATVDCDVLLIYMHASVIFLYVVTFGEILVGLGLIFGVLTGIAAFFGLVMNLNFLLAGAISINPIIGGLALFLILAWRVAGYYGGSTVGTCIGRRSCADTSGQSPY